MAFFIAEWERIVSEGSREVPHDHITKTAPPTCAH